MDYLCGDGGADHFWPVSDLFWNSTVPNLPRCFRRSICAWAPAAVIVVYAFTTLLMDCKRKRDSSAEKSTKPLARFPVIAAVKAGCLVSLAVLAVAEIVLMHFVTGLDEPVDLVYAVAFVTIAILAGGLVFRELRQRIISSAFQFFFWLFTLLTFTPNLKAAIDALAGLEDRKEESPVPIVVILEWVALVLLFFLQFFPNVPGTRGDSEKEATFASRVTYSWMNGVFVKGYSKDGLQFKDYPEPESRVTYGDVTARLSRAVGDHEDISIVSALFRTLRPQIIFGGLIRLTSDLLLIAIPYVMRRLIVDLEVESEFAWRPYFWSILLFLAAVLQITVSNRYFAKMMSCGLQMRTAAISLIYSKGLKLSPSSRGKYSLGEITNLMSIDAQKFADSMLLVHVIWAAPLQIAIVVAFLYAMVGPAAIAGISAVGLLVPLNLLSSRFGRDIQGKQMKAKDERMLLLSEIVQGMKVLKLYAWEIPFIKRIDQIRSREVRSLKRFAIVVSNINVVTTVCSVLNTLVTFATYVSLDPEANAITPDKVFTCLALLHVVSIPMFHLPRVFLELIKLSISVKRLNSFLNAEEIHDAAVGSVKKEENAVEFANATLSWDKGVAVEKATLKELTLNIKKGSLVAILGRVGAGKSSLLSSLLGELHSIGGQVRLSGDVAYVPQQAWIQNMSLRDNILFGSLLDEEKYSAVVHSCALADDLDILPAGDATEIGENGINLSGGQKQRVSVARAVYSGNGLVLLDDPLSAVDSHVAEHMFENVLANGSGMLAGATRVLVTHNLSFLSKMDKVVLLDGGRVVADGKYDELVKSNIEFKEYVKHQLELNAAEEKSRKDEKAEKDPKVAKSRAEDEAKKGRLVSDEKAETGRVKWTHYLHYFRHANWFAVAAIFLMFTSGEVLQKTATIVLSYWTNAAAKSKGILPQSEHNYYIMIIGLVVAVYAVLSYAKMLLLLHRLVEVSRRMSMAALRRVMAAPMAFFDSNPTGRILNRFSSDLDILDNKMPATLLETLWCLNSVLSSLFIIAYQVPYIIIFFVPIFAAGVMLQIFYSATKRQLKRIEAVNKSPIFTKFGETVQGTSTIRAFGQQSRFASENAASVSRHLTCCYVNEIAVRWLTVRIMYCGSLIILLTACFAVYNSTSLTASVAALIITYTASMLDEMNWTVRMTSELEADSVAIERLREYECLEGEGEWFAKDMEGAPSIDGWPDDGGVKFDDYATRYRPDLEDVVKGLNLEVSSGEKLGICGRTGAGKSSLTLALFRIINASKGRLLVGGRDVATVGLQELRSQITIIPQDPVLFSGTVRFNLDPTGLFDDAAIWAALRLAHLSDLVSGFEAGLEQPVTEGGRNLSVGQRQLVCLARALLRKTKVLVLDEATAAMDENTDRLIQRTLATEFSSCTILTIAHRLNTILDYDRVLVMADGKVAECDAPRKLLAESGSQFHKMCKKADLV